MDAHNETIFGMGMVAILMFLVLLIVFWFSGNKEM